MCAASRTEPDDYPTYPETFNRALIILAKRDPDLHKIIAVSAIRRCGTVSGFLVLLILEQQVSLASARAAFDKLTAVAGKLTPERALEHRHRVSRRWG